MGIGRHGGGSGSGSTCGFTCGGTGRGSVLCKRVICLLTLSGGQLVRTKRFRVDRWYSLEAFSFKGADEVVVVDVTPGGPDRVGTAATDRKSVV